MTNVSGRQSLGAREAQEDSYRILRQSDEDPGSDMLIVLADGMGGHVGGEIASRLVVDHFERHCITLSRNPKPVQRMIEAMEVANAALRDRIAREPELAGMGATLVAALKLGTKLTWLSVGDSPLWLWRAGAMRRLNADHSVHGELLALVREGRLTQQEADSNPRRNALRSALIGERIALVDTGSITLQTGDLVVAASDGIDTLDEPRISAILAQPDRKEPRHLTADLLNAVDAMAAPRQDNTTVIVYRHDPAAGIAKTTDSLFAVAAASAPAPKHGPVWAAVGAALVLALGGLIYVVGWGGDPVAPEPQAPPGQAVIVPPPTGVPEPMPGLITDSPVDPAAPQPGQPSHSDPGLAPAPAPSTVLPAPAPVPVPPLAVPPLAAPGASLAPSVGQDDTVTADPGNVPAAPAPRAAATVPSAPPLQPQSPDTAPIPAEQQNPAAQSGAPVSAQPPRPRPRPVEPEPDTQTGSSGKED